MLGIIGKVHLIVGEIEATLMGAEVRPGNHRQVIRIGGVEQGMKICEAGALSRQGSEILVLDGNLVVNVFQNDDYDAIEVVSASAGGRVGGFLFFGFRGLGDL